MSKWSEADKERFINHLVKGYRGTVVSRGEILEEVRQKNLPYPRFILDNPAAKSGRGMYDLGCFAVTVAEPEVETVAMSAQVLPMVRQKKLESTLDNTVPNKDVNYVAFGFHKDLKKILESKIFYPVFITGLSGNGKTTMVEQVCAELKREVLRVNISIETDEDDLIGGNTLIDGNVVYREGPVLMAMKRGAILLIDECDRGSNKLMCLQAIMEGKPYMNKKTGEVVHPAPGFNIVATANTKGKGTDDGRFIAAQMIDEAFLERFAITVEQEYPDVRVEKKILTLKMKELNCLDEDFVVKLTSWAEIIRKTFEEGGVDELISTRRLLHIVKAFAMFNDRVKAIQLCTNRFDAETKSAFLDLYTKVDAPAVAETVAPAAVNPGEEIPF
jgi:MoxR-like ATPase